MLEVVPNRSFNVLFICTGNSARSIMAEAVLNRAGQGRFHAFSAGSHPKGHIHPYALELLQRLHFDVSKLRSKSWTEFTGRTAPSSISLSPSAMTPPPRPVRCGPDSQ